MQWPIRSFKVSGKLLKGMGRSPKICSRLREVVVSSLTNQKHFSKKLLYGPGLQTVILVMENMLNSPEMVFI